MIEELLKAEERHRKEIQEYDKAKYDVKFKDFQKLLTKSGFAFHGVVEDNEDRYIEKWQQPEPENEQIVEVGIVRYYQIKMEWVTITLEYSNPKMWRHYEMESGKKFTTTSVSTNGETYMVATQKIEEMYKVNQQES